MAPLSQLVIYGLLSLATTDASILPKSQIHEFRVDLSSRVPRMLDLIQNTHLPEKPEYPGVGSTLGIDLSTLKSWRTEWLNDFNWEKEQAAINKFKHFTTTIEGLDIHFIYEKSKANNAIPLILYHGWPGSFLEFLPLIDSLVQPAKTSTGKSVSFDVIVPSLPGYGFSSAPPANWTATDSARVFNTLMTQVLGYKTYAFHATDWGARVGYETYDRYNETVRAAHFVFLPFFPKSPEELAAENITLSSSLEEAEEQNFVSWSATGTAYFEESATKPNTLGLALYDNPVGQLAWIGEKFLVWSDPRAGTGVSVLNSNEILRSVSLYYLTRTFVSSVYMYAQNPNGFSNVYTRANTDAPLLFSAFKYNPGFWPEAVVKQVGNLVLYRNHDFGGHFSALDNPPALITDLREIGTYWKG